MNFSENCFSSCAVECSLLQQSKKTPAPREQSRAVRRGSRRYKRWARSFGASSAVHISYSLGTRTASGYGSKMLEHAQLSSLLAGKQDPLWICDLPAHAREKIGCKIGAIYLSRRTAMHILNGHNDIDNFQILFLAVVIERGNIYRDTVENGHYAAIYQDGKRVFYVVFKVVGSGHELWVSSMYRLTEKKKLKKLRRLEAL